MIPNHTQFTTAILDKKKVCVRFYSKPDNGVLDRVCAPLEYGPGENPDGLHRYWLWDYAGEPGSKTIGLVPQQILDLQVLGELFNSAEFIIGPGLAGPVTESSSAPAGPASDAKPPLL